MSPECWFAHRPGAGPCSGPLQKAHWIKQQVLRRELGPGDTCPTCGSERGERCWDLRTAEPMKGFHGARNLGQQALVWDGRVWSWMCESHHRRLDHARSIRVARVDLPAGVEEYARERGLEWYLEREYGPRERLIPLGSRAGVVVGHARVSDEDFERLNALPWHRDACGYAVHNVRVGERGANHVRHVRMHRLVLGLADDDPREADHINGDRLDNRRENLRAVTHAENQQNRHGGRGSSRHRGVDYFEPRGKWRAQGRVDGRKVHIGLYDTEAEAAAAAVEWRREHLPFSNEAA